MVQKYRNSRDFIEDIDFAHLQFVFELIVHDFVGLEASQSCFCWNFADIDDVLPFDET
jgi:hypothetical protein